MEDKLIPIGDLPIGTRIYLFENSPFVFTILGRVSKDGGPVVEVSGGQASKYQLLLHTLVYPVEQVSTTALGVTDSDIDGDW